MYPVSKEYMAAIQNNTRSFYYAGKIITKKGKEYSFGSEDIVKGSAYITNQCCGSSEIELGNVYAAELGISLFSDIDRYSLDDAEITISFFLEVLEGVYEEVPLGVFEISEATRSIKKLTIKAYDRMLRFDKKFSATSLEGTAYDILALACSKCDMELAHTKEEVSTWLNAKVNMVLYQENDIESWRDILYYVAQTVGRFCTVNRMGELELRKFGNEPVINIPSVQRFNSSYSDFVTRYTAISSTNSRTQVSEYYAKEMDNGLTMNLGINPLVQFGLEEARAAVFNSLLDEIGAINYVPFESTTIGNPAIDLGDIISFSGGHADPNQITCVTQYKTIINGKQTLKCVGKNPKLAAAKSKNDKNISALIHQATTDKTIVYTFINGKRILLTEKRQEVAKIGFAAISDTDAQFHASVIIHVEANDIEKKGKITIGEDEHEFSYSVPGGVILTVTYILNTTQIKSYIPIETLSTGDHVLTLYYPISGVEAETFYTFKMMMSISGGSATINMGQILCTITGQGLSASAVGWDGSFEFEENLNNEYYIIQPSVLGYKSNLKESNTINISRPLLSPLNDSLGQLNINLPNRVVFDSHILENIHFAQTNQIVHFFMTESVEKNEQGNIVLKKDIVGPKTIISDIYYLTYSSVYGIENVLANSSDDVLFAISFDKGTTWLSHSATGWNKVRDEVSGMTAGELGEISVDAWSGMAFHDSSYIFRATLFGADSYVGNLKVNYLF